MTRVLVVADTHLPARRLDRMPDLVWREAERADVVVHAGDVVEAEVLDALAAYAPVHAVLGNNDHSLARQLPERLELELSGVPVGVIHHGGPRAGRPARLRRMFPGAAVVIFGHSHQPEATSGVDGQLLFNPGSPTQRRRQPAHTLGILELQDGTVRRAEHLVCDLPAPGRASRGSRSGR